MATLLDKALLYFLYNNLGLVSRGRGIISNSGEIALKVDVQKKVALDVMIKLNENEKLKIKLHVPKTKSIHHKN